MNIYETTATNVLNLLKGQGENIVSSMSLDSTRAIGDAAQEFVSIHLKECIPPEVLSTIENDFTRRSMEDVAFTDKDNHYYAVDVKTHNIDTSFNMPNLVSVQRLAIFYKNNGNYFCMLMVSYKIENEHISYDSCIFAPIENLKWDCLTLGALDWGQIQIANANNILIDKGITRKDWMLSLCDRIETFYEEEIGKIKERGKWFYDIRKFWEKQ